MSAEAEIVATGKTADESWRAKGKCVGVDPDLFVPQVEDPDYKAVVKAAKEVCSECSQRDPCLNYGKSTGSEGVWGGVVLSPPKKYARSPFKKLSLPEQGPQIIDGVFSLTLYSNGQGLGGKPIPLVARRLLYVLDSAPEPVGTEELMAAIYGIPRPDHSDYHKVLIYERRLDKRLMSWAGRLAESHSIPGITRTRLPGRWGKLEHQLVGLSCNFIPLDTETDNIFTPDGFVPTRSSTNEFSENGTVYDSADSMSKIA